ncbi:MAG: hypothetical protein V3W19_14415 [Desulfatiglandales bacterium]
MKSVLTRKAEHKGLLMNFMGFGWNMALFMIPSSLTSTGDVYYGE